MGESDEDEVALVVGRDSAWVGAEVEGAVGRMLLYELDLGGG
jgi:hypothetical protein